MMMPRLEYISEGRGGYIIYKDDKDDIKLFFEFGGRNCMAIIYVPTVEEWTHKTNRSIEDRQAIMEFVAEQCIKDQAPGCYYKLTETYIEIFTL